MKRKILIGLGIAAGAVFMFFLVVAILMETKVIEVPEDRFKSNTSPLQEVGHDVADTVGNTTKKESYLFEIVNIDNRNQRDVDVSAYVTELPTDTILIGQTFERIKEVLKSKGLVVQKKLTIYLYTSKINAEQEDGSKSYFATYFENIENGVVGGFTYNKSLLDILSKQGEYAEFVKFRNEFNKKISLCDYHKQYLEIVKDSYKKANIKYGDGSSDGKFDYLEKVKSESVAELNKKFGISRGVYEQYWKYGQYACDNIP